MADLHIDMAALRRTQSQLSRITDLLDSPRRAMSGLPSDAASNAELRSKLDEFSSEWEYGIGKLGEFSQAGAEALAKIEETFSDLDNELAEGLESTSASA